MTLSHSPSEEIQVPSSMEEILQSETQAHVDNVVKQVNDIFDANPENQEKAYETIKSGITGLIGKEPGKFAEVLDQVDIRYQERLKNFGIGNYRNKEEAITNYTKFLEQMGETITGKAQNIQWQNEQRITKEQYNNKKESLIVTYKNILNSFSNQIKN